LELKTSCCAFAGSDLHVYHGKHPYTSYPVVQGHEFCGEVAEVGPNVQSFGPSFRHCPEAYAFIEENHEKVMKIMIDLDESTNPS
jgi:hypothetical protein